MAQRMSPHRKAIHLPLWVVPWVEGKVTRGSEVIGHQSILQCWECLRNVCNFMFVWVDKNRVLYTAEYSQAPTNMWQSHVKIEGDFVVYFDHIAVFEALCHWTSIKGGAHTCFVDALISNESTKHMSPTLNGNSVIWRFEGSDAIETCNGITFNFYTGLPHIVVSYPNYFCWASIKKYGLGT